jgi:hypothetical protein
MRLVHHGNRAARQLGDGIGLVAEMAAVIEANGATLEILAPSLRDLAEVVGATRAGAHQATMLLDPLKSLGGHPLSERASEALARFS